MWKKEFTLEKEDPVPEPIYANKMRGLINALQYENHMNHLPCEPKEEPYFTAAYGEVPTFDGKPVEIKKQDVPIDEAIKSFRQTLKDCATKCKYCYHLLDEFDNIIIRLKEEHHDNT